MQLFDFLRGRWLAVIVAAVAIASILTFVVAQSSAASAHKARAEASVLQALPSGSSGFDIDIYTEQVVVEFNSRPVHAAVAQDTDMTSTEVDNALEAREVGNAGTVAVGFTADDATTAENGLRTATRSALLAISERELASLERGSDSTDALRARLEAELLELETAAGLSNVDAALTETGRRIDTIELQLAQTDDPAVERRLNELLDGALVEQANLQSVFPGWQAAQAELDVVRLQEARAEVDLVETREIVNRLAVEDPLTGLDVEELSPLLGSVRSAMTAGAVAGVLATGAALVSQQLKARSRRETDTDDNTITDHAAAAPAPTERATPTERTTASKDSPQTETAAQASTAVSATSDVERSAPAIDPEMTVRMPSPFVEDETPNDEVDETPGTAAKPSTTTSGAKSSTDGPPVPAAARHAKDTRPAKTAGSHGERPAKSDKSASDASETKRSTKTPKTDAVEKAGESSSSKVTRIDLRPWSLWEVDGEVQVRRDAESGNKSGDKETPAAEIAGQND